MKTDKPYSFQARSKKAFKKGELMLFPVGKLIPKGGNLNPYEDPQSIAKAKYSLKQINPGHIPTVPFSASMSQTSSPSSSKLKKKVRRGAGKGAGSQPDRTAADQQAPRLDMLMPSPASLLSYSPQHDVVPPFWAVCRHSRALSDESNMELRQVTMKVPFPTEPSDLAKFAGFSEKVNLPECAVTFVAMFNTKAIAVGDVLALPFFSRFSSLVE